MQPNASINSEMAMHLVALSTQIERDIWLTVLNAARDNGRRTQRRESAWADSN